MPAKRAAVPPDVLDRNLGDISAADLIGALDRSRLGEAEIRILADKKKYELWIDETPIEKIPLKDLFDRLRGEKKKLELEKRPWEQIKREVEIDIDPRRILDDPAFRDELVREIADEVVRRVGR